MLDTRPLCDRNCDRRNRCAAIEGPFGTSRANALGRWTARIGQVAAILEYRAISFERRTNNPLVFAVRSIRQLGDRKTRHPQSFKRLKSRGPGSRCENLLF